MLFHNGARVLIVDDDAPTLRVLSRFLRQRAYEPILASSGAEALEVVSMGPLDAVLLDLNMPGLNGIDVLSLIRRRRPCLPVIVVSGVIDVQLAQEAFRDGAFDYLVKPFHLENLGQTLHQALLQRFSAS